jgi:uncharacterized repeat protein (TIGR01451 family)
VTQAGAGLVRLAGVLAAVFVVLFLGGPRAEGGSTRASTLIKTAVDVRDGSTAGSGGPVGKAGTGDTIDWVLHYSNATGSNADVDITDPLGANQTYVSGSLQTPPGFLPEWSINGGSGYVSTEPASGVNAVGATGSSVPGSTGASAQLGAPPAAIAPSGGGDGWEPLFIGSNLYNVFHGFNTTPLDCHVLSTGARCPGYPTYASPNAGDPLGTGPHTLQTEGFEAADVVGSRIYYPVAITGTSSFGVACADVASNTSCGYTQLGTGGGAPTIGGGAVVGSKYYLIDRNVDIDCFDTSTGAPCASGPITGADPGAGAPPLFAYYDLQAWDGRYLFGNYERSRGGTRDLICVDLDNNGANCPGFPKVGYGGVANGSNLDATLVPILDAAGDVQGICGATGTGTSHTFACFDLDGNAVPTPFSTTQTTGTGVNWENLGSVAVVGSRVYFAESVTGAGAPPQGTATYTCWDYATSSPCQGFTAASTGKSVRAYALGRQPGTDCVWEYGDAGVFENFSATFGGTSCNEGSAQVSLSPSQYYCDGQSGHVTGWKQITLDGITSSDYSGAVVTITDSNGNVVPGWQGKIIPNTQQAIDISSIPYAGSTTTLHVSVAVNWGSGTAKPVTVAATYSGDAPEVCFKTTVGTTKCDVSQSISNDATAVTNGVISDAPGGDRSGKATFIEGPDPTTKNCNADLSVTKDASSSSVPPGGQVMYTLVVHNKGPDVATDTTLSDPLPAGLSVTSAQPSQGSCSVSGSVECSLGTVQDGGFAQVLVIASVSGSATGRLQNCATTAAFQADSSTANNSACSTTAVSPSSPSPSPQLSSDLKVLKRASSHRAYPGAKITYTLEVANPGADAAQNAKITDTWSLPLRVLKVDAGQGSCHKGPPVTCQLGALPAGHRATVTVVAEPTVAGAELNTATITSSSSDPNGSNNLSSAKTTLKSRLELRKTASRRSASAGQTVTYQIAVTNPTDLAIRHAQICDALPRGLLYTGSSPRAHLSNGRYCWAIRTLKAHRSQRFRMSANVEPGKGGRLINRATAAANGVRGARAAAAVVVRTPPPVPCASASSVGRPPPIARIAC